MIRYYCDICNKETKIDYVGNRLKSWVGKIGVEVMLGLNNTWNDGHFCLTCIQQATNKLIDEERTRVGGEK